MPCLSYEPVRSVDEVSTARNQLYETQKSLARVEAALCSALSFIQSKEKMTEYQSITDWAEVGVRFQEVLSWWDAHKVKDAARKQKETDLEISRLALVARVRDLESKPWVELSKKDLQFLSRHGTKPDRSCG